MRDYLNGFSETEKIVMVMERLLDKRNFHTKAGRYAAGLIKRNDLALFEP